MTIRQRATLLVLLIPGTGCASLTDAQWEHLEYERASYEAEFLDYRARCTQTGKRIWISARGKVGRDGIPSRGDVYYCG